MVQPGAFVPKPSGKGLRLVTNYRDINKHIKRPVYPFPDFHTLKTNIPSNTKFLAKVDFSSDYFQVGLAEKSRDLKCFILPLGRFLYHRTPMGMASRGDLLVDNILVAEETFSQLIHHLYVLLQRLEKNNATISLKKFE